MRTLLIVIFLISLQLSYAQGTKFDSYVKSRFILHKEEKLTHIIHGMSSSHFVILSFTSNIYDSLAVFVNKKQVKLILSSDIYNEDDFDKSSFRVNLDSLENKTAKITVFSMKTKRYITFLIDNKYKIIQVFFDSDIPAIRKRNTNVIIE